MQHSQVISDAEDNSKLDAFDVELLKVLFMIKYVKEIKANVDNLTTLMISSIYDERVEVRKKVEQSLKRLIGETLVQKNGEIYIFLTNEEQEINNAINSETVELGEIIGEVSMVIFEEIYKEKKFRYSNRYMFPFNQKVDDRFYKGNQSNGIGLTIITPYGSEYTDAALRLLSASEQSVIMKLPNDTTFLDEIRGSIQIYKYLNKNASGAQDSFESIRRAKEDERLEKKDRIRIYIEEALKNADIYVNGDKAVINAKEASSRIDEAMRKLVETQYNKLTYMETAPELSDIAHVLRDDGGQITLGVEDTTPNKLASTGLEPDKFSDRAKWLLVARMIPLVENNFNLCELGPRSTGKSYIYEQISPNSILVAGGQTTVANLFYNMSSHTVGLVGMWDCVAFDEVAGIKFKDKDGIQIMKGYMASGAFSRGKAEITAKASMVFVGNINQSVDTLLKTSSLFDPFPPEMGTDTAFLDRMHCYIPGWEIPKYRPESFTNDYGFITDYLSEFMRELRKDSYSDIADKYFKLGNNLNQRDTIAVRKMISGFIKLLYPDGEASKEEVREVVEISLELRRRVKEQLKKIGGMEFYDVNFSYIDNDSFDEHYVGVPEQGAGKLIPEGMGKPGSLYTVSKSKTGMIGCYHLETQMMPGNGKLTCTGIGSGKESKEATNTAFNYLKANGNAISGQISTTTKDYIINYQDMQGIGMTGSLALPTLIAISSAALNKPMVSSMAVLGEISIGGTLIKVEELASTLQVCLDSGAKKVLLPITSAADLGTVPSDLVGAFSLIFYSSPEEAVYKALGVE